MWLGQLSALLFCCPKVRKCSPVAILCLHGTCAHPESDASPRPLSSNRRRAASPLGQWESPRLCAAWRISVLPGPLMQLRCNRKKRKKNTHIHMGWMNQIVPFHNNTSTSNNNNQIWRFWHPWNAVRRPTKLKQLLLLLLSVLIQCAVSISPHLSSSHLYCSEVRGGAETRTAARVAAGRRGAEGSTTCLIPLTPLVAGCEWAKVHRRATHTHYLTRRVVAQQSSSSSSSLLLPLLLLLQQQQQWTDTTCLFKALKQLKPKRSSTPSSRPLSRQNGVSATVYFHSFSRIQRLPYLRSVV